MQKVDPESNTTPIELHKLMEYELLSINTWLFFFDWTANLVVAYRGWRCKRKYKAYVYMLNRRKQLILKQAIYANK